mgnify:CR=1 FL=1
MQGGEDALFSEVARVLIEYGFIHPGPPPCRRIESVLSLQLTKASKYPVIVADSQKAAIQAIVDSKKTWGRVAVKTHP